MVASISAVSSAAAARDYYSKDNYYAKGEDEREPSAWFGKGAHALGLKGPVDLETFERVLSGETLNGGAVGQRPGDTLDQALARPHRPGVDLTFSPPKNVSLLLYLGGDQRLLSAHRKAVNKTLKWAERNLAGTRIRPTLPDGSKGPAEAIKTGNYVIAKFEHDISRDKDPQLHTHSVIANMTKAADGSWRALYNDPLFAHRKTLSLAYDAAMREEVRALGYKVQLTDGKSGAYQIEGVPGEAREEFSKGAARIDKAAARLENPTPAARAKLAVKTRPSKTTMTREERAASWEAQGAPWIDRLKGVAADAALRAEAGRIETPLSEARPERAGLAGAAARALQNRLRPTHGVRLNRDDPYAMDRAGSARELAARSAVSFALKHSEEREAAFSLHHLRRAALEHGADGVTIKDVDKELRLLRRSNKVMAKAGDPDGLATTRASLTHEERTLALVAGAGSASPLASSMAVEAVLKGSALTAGQRGAIDLILASDSRLVGVQGYAGTGKTTMMRQTKELLAALKPAAESQGIPILGLAPTHAARKELTESLGVDAQTVARLLATARRGEGSPAKGAVVVVDESSFLSTKQMNRLLTELLKQDPARIILVGDRRQHGAVDAGRPFDQAQAAGMPTAVMKDVVRLPTDKAYDDRRAAVIAAGEGQVKTAMARLSANIVERTDGDLAAGVVEVWKGLDQSAQTDAMLVAPSHRIREGINRAVRDLMIADGRLGDIATTVSVRRSQDMTKAEAASPRTYAPGDLLLFHARHDAVNAKKGAVRTVVSVNENSGLVTLRNAKGGLQTIKADTLAGRNDTAPYSLNREEGLELRTSDQLLFTRSDAERDLAALTRATVKRFDETTVTLTIDGKDKVFERSDPSLASLTHGYAITSHASQGQTAPHVIAAVDSKERALANQTGFYVSISRSAETLAVVVDDKERVLGALQQNTGMNASSMEALAKIDDIAGIEQATSQIPEKSNLGPDTSNAGPIDENTGSASSEEHGSPPDLLDQEISL